MLLNIPLTNAIVTVFVGERERERVRNNTTKY